MAEAATSPGVPVFAWTTGQDFNIGDSLLRRPYIDQLATLGPVDIWVRTASPGFLTGLGTSATTVSTSFASWYLRALRSAVRRPTVIALNAGEMWISWDRALLVVLLALAGVVARVRGGFSVWLGASVRPAANPVQRALYRFATRLVSIVRWREPQSNVTALPRPVGPDWAFAAGSATDEWAPADGRGSIGFVLRGDRPRPDADWFDWARELVASTGLAPLAVVQVENDLDRARELVEALGGAVVTWEPGTSHADQEAKVRDVYRGCAVVVGDRLHGLVVAATEGAVPIGWLDTSGGKVGRHFDAAGMPFVGAFEGEAFAHRTPLTKERLGELAAALPAEIDGARGQLDEVGRLVLGRARRAAGHGS